MEERADARRYVPPRSRLASGADGRPDRRASALAERGARSNRRPAEPAAGDGAFAAGGGGGADDKERPEAARPVEGVENAAIAMRAAGNKKGRKQNEKGKPE